MLQARKSKWFNALFHAYNKHYLLPRHFDQILLRGELDPPDLRRPVLYAMNHSSWWDGLLMYHAVKERSAGDHFIMMDERQLSKFRFFQKLGAFSIHKQSMKGILRSLHYASELMEQGKSVWIFPQGDIYHNDVRPLHFQPGISYLLSRSPSPIVIPVTTVFSMTYVQKPVATMWAGTPIEEDWSSTRRRESSAWLAARLEQQLDRHKALVVEDQCGPQSGFNPILKKSSSTDAMFEDFQRRTQWWKRFFKSS